MRINMILALFFNLVELSVRIRIFDFFAYFVRQCREIVFDALPLGTMLGFQILA